MMDRKKTEKKKQRKKDERDKRNRKAHRWSKKEDEEGKTKAEK
jgi:hypothetical protein